MRLEATYGRLRLAAMAVGLLVALQGCIWDGPLEEDSRDSSFHLSVTVLAGSSAATRAGHTDDFEENGTAAENYIDFDGNDFRIVLFDNQGDYLLELDGLDRWSMFPHATEDDYSLYRMECEIKFPETMSQDKIEQIRTNGFQVMVLANWKNARNSGYANLFTPGGGTAQDLGSIWKDKTNYNFQLYTQSGDISTWRPDHQGTTKRLIPMFGIAKAPRFTPRNGGELYSASTIKMQRTVAKIEVLDNLKDQPSLSVDGVTMTAFNASGRFIPDVAANANWDKVGEQVDVSSIPADVQKYTNLQFFHQGGTRDSDGKVSGGKWIAYVPEMALDKLSVDATTKAFDPESVVAQARPHLDVKIGSTLDFYEGGNYPAHFAVYNQNFEPTIPDESWNHILRNHIYRFSVNKVGLSVDLHLHVIPWVLDEDEEWDFTDHVTVQQMLDWNPNTYSRLDEDTGEVVLQVENGKSLEGNFRISTPLNGRWYVRLTPLGEAKTNAVSFVDKDGNVLQPSSGDPAACLEISGLIDTQNEVPTVFYIRPTNNGNDQESAFRLEFFVENLGVWMEVPMTEGGKYKYYTIVRPANIIE